MASEKSLTPWGERILALLDGRPRAGLAKEAGLDVRTLGDIIHKTTPAADKAVKIADALGTTVEWLIEGRGLPPGGKLRLAEPGVAFADPPAEQLASMRERMRLAQLQLEEATQAVGVIPDEALRQVLYGLLFKHRIPVEDVAIILSAKARKVT
jgi:transcriptional regulator with XRE-family HTH domain